MTTYFDDKHTELSRIAGLLEAHGKGGLVWRGACAALEEVDRVVVWDVSLCSEMPGFPVDLVREVDEAVLRWSSTSQPANRRGGPAPDTVTEQLEQTKWLVFALHTVFHVLGSRGLDGFSDSPLAPIRELYERAEERRERHVKDPGWSAVAAKKGESER
jgi:hypothetical protein